MVSKRAHKLCDTVNGTGGRRMKSAVLLDGLRCDGKAFGDCEMQCLLFWKESWLKRADAKMDSAAAPRTASSPRATGTSSLKKCTEADVWAATQLPSDLTGLNEQVHVCQATQLPGASAKLPMWSPWQYIEDVTSGNVTLSQTLCSLLFVAYAAIAESGLGFGWVLRSGYDVFQRLCGGTPYPERRGLLPKVLEPLRWNSTSSPVISSESSRTGRFWRPWTKP